MTDTEQSNSDDQFQRLIEGMRVLIVGGIPFGVLVAGVGSRLAMFLLRVTSSDRVVGITSDDGFTIGQVTLGGTYNLLMLGAAVGIIGAGAYLVVAPWLIGPTWFRRLTTGLASAAVVGSMLVHADGIDFTLLEPTWLAIGLFVALPGLFGTLVGSAVDRVSEPDSWTAQGRRRWLLPLIAVVLFPLTVPLLVFASAILGLWIVVEGAEFSRRMRRIPLYSLALRSVWLLIAVAGLVALVKDIDALT
ncbi:MAG: hypothetical protein WD895_01220 [Acidimicrobiia bacterium]